MVCPLTIESALALIKYTESVIDVILHAEMRDRMILLRGLLFVCSQDSEEIQLRFRPLRPCGMPSGVP